MPIGTGRTTGSFVAGAIRLAVGGLNHRTSSFVMCASSAREPGGTRPIAMRCWRFAVPSIMARSIGYSSGIDGAYEKRKNHRMLLTELPCQPLFRYISGNESPRNFPGQSHE